MQNLADTVLEYFWFLSFSSDNQVDPDTAVEKMEHLVYAIENTFSDAERRALQDAAKRSLARWMAEPDEFGYTPRKLLTSEMHGFLQSIIDGRFSGELDED